MTKMKQKTETGIRSKCSASGERATTGSRKEKQEIVCMRDIALLCNHVELFLAQDCLITEKSNRRAQIISTRRKVLMICARQIRFAQCISTHDSFNFQCNVVSPLKKKRILY